MSKNYFPQGCCLGHFDENKSECKKSNCKYSDDCKDITFSDDIESVRTVMKNTKKAIENCIKEFKEKKGK